MTLILDIIVFCNYRPGQNLVALMVSMGMIWTVLFTGVLGQWTINDTNLYSSILVWYNVVSRIKRVLRLSPNKKVKVLGELKFRVY